MVAVRFIFLTQVMVSNMSNNPIMKTVDIKLQQTFDSFLLAVKASYEARDELLIDAKRFLGGKEVYYLSNSGEKLRGIIIEVFPHKYEGVKVHVTRKRANGLFSKSLHSVPVDNVLKFLEVR